MDGITASHSKNSLPSIRGSLPSELGHSGTTGRKEPYGRTSPACLLLDLRRRNSRTRKTGFPARPFPFLFPAVAINLHFRELQKAFSENRPARPHPQTTQTPLPALPPQHSARGKASFSA